MDISELITMLDSEEESPLNLGRNGFFLVEKGKLS